MTRTKSPAATKDPNRDKCPCGEPDCPCGAYNHARWSPQGFGCIDCRWTQTPPKDKERTRTR